MTQIVQLNLNDIIPEPESILINQGVPEGRNVSSRTHQLLAEARDLFATTARPVGLRSEILKEGFNPIFEGEGENTPDNPLLYIFPAADNLALMALTLGKDISVKIEKLFDENNFALGLMLDTMASLAADKAVEVCQRSFSNDLSEKYNRRSNHTVLSYSPGYCGWHISGQKKIFQYLRPERIGISLNKSFLMNPLKSVTGLLVAGKKEIHLFKANYPFCRSCKDAACQERMKRILNT